MSQEKFFLTAEELKRRNDAFRKEVEQLRKINDDYDNQYYPEKQTQAQPSPPGKVK